MLFLVQQIKSVLKIFSFTRNVFFVKQRKKFQDIKLRVTEQERPHTKIPQKKRCKKCNRWDTDTDMSYGMIFAHQTDPI